MRLLAAAVLAIVVGPPSVAVHVNPARGGPQTSFKVSFRVPQTTGNLSGAQRYDVVNGQAGAPRTGCIPSFTVRVPDAVAGTQMSVTLAPRALGGRWCAGSYAGRVEQLQSPVCAPGKVCPLFIMLTPLGHFTLHVARS